MLITLIIILGLAGLAGSIALYERVSKEQENRAEGFFMFLLAFFVIVLPTLRFIYRHFN